MGRTSAKAQVLVEAQSSNSNTPRPVRKVVEKSPAVPAKHDIPYFADMELNPARYPTGKFGWLSTTPSRARFPRRPPATSAE
jgi:hypothetical protein